MAVTVRDALDYLRIDEADDQILANVERAMNSAAARLRKAIGDDVEDYLPDDACVDQLHLLYTRENYDAENLTEKEIRALKHLRDDLEPQLRRDLSRKRAEVAAGGDTD